MREKEGWSEVGGKKQKNKTIKKKRVISSQRELFTNCSKDGEIVIGYKKLLLLLSYSPTKL
jgi:hypothetical protein